MQSSGPWTRNRAKAKALAAMAAAFLAASAGAAAAQEFLTQAQLLATFPGKTVQSKSDDGTPWAQAYSKGRKKGKINGKFGDQDITARWYVEGDTWCEDWGSGSACWQVEQVDANSFRMYANGKPRKNLWVVR